MRVFRQLICIVFSAFLLLTMASCGWQKSTKYEISPYSAYEIAQVILSDQAEQIPLAAYVVGDKNFEYQVANGYFIDSSQVVDGVVCYSLGFEATEVAVLLMNSEEDAQEAATSLQTYIAGRVKAFSGYAPEQAALAEQGEVIQNGKYVALLICDTGRARESFFSCFSPELPPLPESSPFRRDVTASSETAQDSKTKESTSESETVTQPKNNNPEDVYSPSEILRAWESGDNSSLTAKNRAILAMCENIIDEVITADMTDYDKELAIHDWIISWSDYDWAVNSQDPDAQVETDNDNPYGLLIKQKSICWGYSKTFQLFMDMLDIECITVGGTANENNGEHSWNQVRLDGEWYCVDVTWDDPYGQLFYSKKSRHRFFNITSQFMRKTLHYWDESMVPECTATKYQWQE